MCGSGTRLAWVGVLTLLLAGCQPAPTDPAEPVPPAAEAIASPAPTEAPPPSAPPADAPAPAFRGTLESLQKLNIYDARAEVVLEGLDRPWALEFIADDEVLITEIGGRLLRYRFGDPSPRPIDGLPVIDTSNELLGLLDVALHPGFAQNRRIYFSYSKGDENAKPYTLTAVATARLGESSLEDLEVILEAGPYSWSYSNSGGALAFDDRGFLYVSIGDRGEHQLAQRGDRLQGKILRLHDDGRVPADNPFVGDPDIDDRIYALGVRNPQGLQFDPVAGVLYEAEHGPLGGDEVNRIIAGGNYGWPEITYGLSYRYEKMGQGTHAPGMQQPLFYYLPSEAISKLLVYRGAMFPEWEGDLLLGALKGQHVSRLDIDGDRVRSEYPILGELNARIRDLKVGPDGALFVLVQTGVLYRIHRDGKPDYSVPDLAPPAMVYDMVCAGCHTGGAYGAPDPANAEAWAKILAQPRAQTLRHTLEGKGAMPPRGLCHLCTDEQIEQTLDLMLERARAAGK